MMTLLCVMFFPALCLSSSVIFLLVDACVGLNWLLVSFLSHVNKNIIHSFIHSGMFTPDEYYNIVEFTGAGTRRDVVVEEIQKQQQRVIVRTVTHR